MDKRYYNFNPGRQPAIPHINIPGSIKGSAVIATGDYNIQINDSIIICDSATDIIIKTLNVNTNERVFTNDALSISLVAGDYLEIKGVQPTWATNPATTIYGGYLYFE